MTSTPLALVRLGRTAAELRPHDLDDRSGEPRLHDLHLAQMLAFTDIHKIRDLISRNRAELEGFGTVSATVAETSGKGGRAGREYWLNEGQALVLCALARTPQAAAVRRAVIEVFMAYRRGKTLCARGGALREWMQRQESGL